MKQILRDFLNAFWQFVRSWLWRKMDDPKMIRSFFFSETQVRFSNAVKDTAWWENYYCDGNVVAFSRGDKGFFAMVKYGTVSQVSHGYLYLSPAFFFSFFFFLVMNSLRRLFVPGLPMKSLLWLDLKIFLKNHEIHSTLFVVYQHDRTGIWNDKLYILSHIYWIYDFCPHQTFQTGMPAGTYQDVVSCQEVTVNGDGSVHISITNEEEPVFAICVGCDCSEPPVVTATPGPGEIAATLRDFGAAANIAKIRRDDKVFLTRESVRDTKTRAKTGEDEQRERKKGVTQT